MKQVLMFFAFAVCLSAQAAPISIIDSGTDMKHNDIAPKAWINPGETDGNGADDDGNGLVDDIYGWNFAENNNQVIDYKYLGKFSKDVYTFFEVQFKIMTGVATEDEIKWYKAKTSDENFIKELSKFGNFVHGTHVAGITAKDAPLAKIQGVKLIPTEAGLGFFDVGTIGKVQSIESFGSISPITDMLIRMGLGQLAKQQMKALKTIGEYVNKTGMKVANCSFGTSMAQARMILAQLLQTILKREPTAEEVDTYAKVFINEIVKSGKDFIGAAPNTLFVIAAGNDGTNNDVLPTSPANVKMANSITVAATWDYKSIAKFSNFGTKMVEIAAPGVGIRSAIPGNEYLAVSGTSQATPFVANIIGRMIDANDKLTHADIKALLMGTVDKKDFLTDKVTSGGIANADRAVEAAKLALGTSVADAIAKARAGVPDVKTPISTMGKRFVGYVIPLTPMFVMAE